MKNKKILIMVSAVILLSVVLFIGSLISKQDTELDEVKLNDLNKDSFAIMVEQSDGTYAESNTYPTGNYMLSKDRSGCIDKHGKSIPNSVSYKNGTVTFKTNSSSYCYVYFDKLTLVKYLLNEETRPSSLWTSTLDGDGYRFVGTDPSNYLCFGIEDKDTCVGNTDLYMYRIIGIFKDSEGKQYVKLIKKEALNTSYAWHSPGTTNANWGDSALYTGLNGGYFLNNTTYSYMQNEIWSGKIKDWAWSAVNTLASSGPNYYTGVTSSQIYYHEMNHENKTSTVGEWTNPSGKIGLMYIGDYMLSLGESALSYKGSSNSATLNTGWMVLTKSDSTAPSAYEWSISRYGKSGSYYHSWYISSGGYPSNQQHNVKISVRPVFYLVSNEEYVSGTGSKTDPFMLDGRPKYTVSLASNNENYGTLSSTSLTVYEGDNINITLSPAKNYKYSSNTLGGTVSGNVLTIDNVTSNISGTVTFVEKTKYTINVSSNNTSYGTVSPTTQTIYEGDSASFTLSPKTGYAAVSTTCGTIKQGVLNVETVTGNLNCEVEFKKTFASGLLEVAPQTLSKSSLSGDGYRFVGTNPDNYVCFGTNNKSTCVGSPSTYLYRIIGLFENKNGVYVPKLIMSRDSGIYGVWSWTATSHGFSTQASWANSSLRTSLNDTGFYNNSTYVPDSDWKSLISQWDFIATTAQHFSSNFNPSRTAGIRLDQLSASQLYKYEMKKLSSSYISWITATDYIGVMYYSDLKLSGGWLIDSYANDRVMAAAANGYEVRLGSTDSTTDCYALGSYLSGETQTYPYVTTTSIGGYEVDMCAAKYGASEDYRVRPSFYLSTSAYISSGTGTLDDPYIIGY